MAINKKLIHFKSKQKFNEELANGNILDTSIVFIQDSKEIYTHGQYYGDLSECLTKYPQEFTKEEKDQMLENLGYYFIEWDGESETMELSEEEYAKLSEATIPLFMMGGSCLYPTMYVKGVLLTFTMNAFGQNITYSMNVSTRTLRLSAYERILPTSTSDLENDSNFISSDNLKTINGESIIGEGDIIIPTKVSQLENDANYIQDDVISDGVYAVDANGKLIDYNTADATATGVALVAGEHKFMIAKSDATDGSNSTLYWTNNTSDLSLTNYTKSDGTNSFGYLPKPDGTFGGSTHLSDDFTTWKAGALSDFNGKANTAVIAAASSKAKDMCTVLNTFNASDSFKDWYVPACGQLALMYLNMTEINAALEKIGGTALAAGGLWSSSEYSSNIAWCVYFINGSVRNDNKDFSRRVRFIRDISVKPLKERVSDLESKIIQLNAVLVDTEEEVDDSENIDEIIQSDWNETDFTSGAYIKNKPTIPSESTVSEWGFTKNTGTYSKPSTGIPKSDLASEVQASLGKADTALQSYTEQYKGTITGVSANGTSVATSGVANIPAASTSKYGVTKLSSATNSTSTSLAATASAVKTAYDLANGRQAKLVSGTNIKTINGNSILGSGNLEIGGSSAYPRVDHGVTNTTFSLSPNTFYVWGEVDTLDLSFAEEQAGVANEYLFQFTSSEEPTTLTLPDTIQWVNEVKIESKKIHQVSVMDNIGIIACPSRVIIRFSVVKTGVTSEYTCELGMTWGEWVNSVYVRDGWYNYQGYITSPDQYQISDIVADDIIESGRIYSTW